MARSWGVSGAESGISALGEVVMKMVTHSPASKSSPPLGRTAKGMQVVMVVVEMPVPGGGAEG